MERDKIALERDRTELAKLKLNETGFSRTEFDRIYGTSGISGADVHDIFSLKVARIEALNSTRKIGAISTIR